MAKIGSNDAWIWPDYELCLGFGDDSSQGWRPGNHVHLLDTAGRWEVHRAVRVRRLDPMLDGVHGKRLNQALLIGALLKGGINKSISITHNFTTGMRMDLDMLRATLYSASEEWRSGEWIIFNWLLHHELIFIHWKSSRRVSWDLGRAWTWGWSSVPISQSWLWWRRDPWPVSPIGTLSLTWSNEIPILVKMLDRASAGSGCIHAPH